MSVDTGTQKDLETRLVEMAKSGREQFDAWFKDAKMGQREPDDQQFMLWWQLHTQPVNATGQPNPQFDPDWVRCLPYVEGGKEIMRRAAKAMKPPEPPRPNQGLPPLSIDPREPIALEAN